MTKYAFKTPKYKISKVNKLSWIRRHHRLDTKVKSENINIPTNLKELVPKTLSMCVCRFVKKWRWFKKICIRLFYLLKVL